MLFHIYHQQIVWDSLLYTFKILFYHDPNIFYVIGLLQEGILHRRFA